MANITITRILRTLPAEEIVQLNSGLLLYTRESENLLPVFIQENEDSVTITLQDSIPEDKLVEIFSSGTISEIGYSFKKEQLENLLDEKHYCLIPEIVSLLNTFERMFSTPDRFVELLICLNGSFNNLQHIINGMFIMFEDDIETLMLCDSTNIKKKFVEILEKRRNS